MQKIRITILLAATLMLNLLQTVQASQPIHDPEPEIRQNSKLPANSSPINLKDLLPQRPAVGNLDTTFAGNVSEGDAQVYALAVQPDGKILAGGFFTGVDGARRATLWNASTLTGHATRRLIPAARAQTVRFM